MKKRTIILSHLALWVLTILMDLLPLITFEDKSKALLILFDTLIDTGCVAITFYFFYFIISTRFLTKKKIIVYIALVICLPLIYSYILALFNSYIHYITREYMKDYSFALIFLQKYSINFAYALWGSMFRFTIDWYQESQRQKELERQNIASELALLRSQINPMFLFSTLNHIDELIKKKESANASYSIIKLSEIMRYMLYEANAEFVHVDKEINYLKNYIDIQKRRNNEAECLNFYVEGETKNFQIPPMLLIHFVENAFRHGKIVCGKYEILIYLKISDNNLDFFIENFINENSEKSEGQGLNKVRKRLDLIYGKDYKLITKSENNKFYVNLNINLTSEKALSILV